MLERIDIHDAVSLNEYAGHLHLAQSVDEMQYASRENVTRLREKKVWMVNSTDKGGGVAEMLPQLVVLLRDLGVDTEWLVVGGDDERFFEVTKKVHNMLHGEPGLELTADDRAVYESGSRAAADALATQVGQDDVLVIHDPQPLGAGSILATESGVRAVWRCHIGLDSENKSTREAWNFLRPWTQGYRRHVFSFPEYVPDFLEERSTIISPAIDPLSEKNRNMSVRKVAGVLTNARMDGVFEPMLNPPYDEPAMRVQPDGSFAPADSPTSIGLITRPIITQISRWDRLKGWGPLLKGFEYLKRGSSRSNGRADGATGAADGTRSGESDLHARRIGLTRLLLVGPDPEAVQDDPQGLEVFDELCARWAELPAEIQDDVVILMLPMTSRPLNARMVNALQRCSSIVAQNSLKEGFGLTVTEGMWKRRPILGTHAVGIRNQVRDGVEGRLVENPEDPEEVAGAMNDMLADPDRCDQWGRNAQRRVADKFLIFNQVERWLSVLGQTRRAGAAAGSA